MTTASIRTIPTQPHGLERIAVRVGLALVRWGHVRTERAAVSHAEHGRRVALERSLAEREQSTRRYGIVR